MMDCNFQEIRILNMLLSQDYIEPEAMMRAISISLRTVQLEIGLINAQLSKAGHMDIQIRNHRGKGYYLSYPKDEVGWVQKLTQQSYDYLSLRMNGLAGKNGRVPHIIRHLLRADGWVKSEHLAELLNVSIATLNKDLRIVRHCLGAYGLGIRAVPHYGMKLLGKEMAMRSCMIDFCDIYSYSSDAIFVQHCLDEFYITREQLEENKGDCLRAIRAYGYGVTDSGFIRLVLYLALLPLRLGRGLEEPVSFSGEMVPRKVAPEAAVPEAMVRLTEYRIAVELLGSGYSSLEYCYLALFLMSVADSLNGTAIHSARQLVKGGEAIVAGVLERLSRKIGLDPSLIPGAFEALERFVNQWLLHKEWGICELERSEKIGKTINKMPSSSALAVYILAELPGVSDADYQDMLFYELVLCIYSAALRLKNEYLPTNIILVNEMGRQTNPIVIERMGIGSFNVIFHECYVYELEGLDFSQYDYLLIAKGTNFDAATLPIPVYWYDFYVRRDQNIWYQLIAKKRKIGAIWKYFENPCAVYLDCGQDGLVREVAGYLWDSGGLQVNVPRAEFEGRLRHIMYDTCYITPEGIQYMNIFAGPAAKQKYFIFNLRLPVPINGKAVRAMHVIVLDMSKGFVEIKNGDSEIRHHIEKN